ncbi:hypothetical protein [Halogeometricum borinquense]|uniref:hypothetical protein n=1 Tax=Halogeometricum borinquense TaxID=60847 RepID=UPI00344045A7
MKAVITGENDERVGVNLRDNNGVEHVLEMEFDGDIKYHKCEEYANNPALRTRENTEHGEQARRYAKWHVYRERGYDTVSPIKNPDRILAGLLATALLSDDKFNDYFGELEQRLQRHYDGSEVKLPFPDADPDDAIVYQQDIYLQPDPTEFEPPVLEQFLNRFQGESDSSALSDVGDIPFGDMDTLHFEIEAVSDIHILHNDGQGNQQVHHGEQPLARDPDARVELMAFDPTSLESFQHYIVSNLAYQIRDRFLLMGEKPPITFQAQGWGSYEGFQRQKFCSLYEDYWSSEATISSWEPWAE